MTVPFPGWRPLVPLGALFLGACAVPMPVQVASWALDGVSYLVTQKSVTDHGISFIMQQDCALLRGVQGKSICKEYDDAGTVAVAASGAASDTSKTPQSTAATEKAAVATLSEVASFDAASFDTASGPEEVPPTADTVEAPKEPPVSGVKDALKTIPPPVVVVATTGERILILGRRTWSVLPEANLYYVIGSFLKRDNAKHLVERQSILGPSVMATRIDGVERYRVAVGPFTRAEQVSVRRTIRAAGISDSWAISIDRSQWVVAGPSGSKNVFVALPEGVKRNGGEGVKPNDNKRPDNNAASNDDKHLERSARVTGVS